MGARSAERAEFLEGVVTTAVEGGTGYWAQVSQYQYVGSDGEVVVYTGEQVGEGTRAVLHELKADESGYEAEGLTLDADAVAKGIGKITRGEVGVRADLKALIAQASRESDAGDIDAEGADVIAQAALLGEVRYG